jgi:hypothetical protein
MQCKAKKLSFLIKFDFLCQIEKLTSIIKKCYRSWGVTCVTKEGGGGKGLEILPPSVSLILINIFQPEKKIFATDMKCKSSSNKFYATVSTIFQHNRHSCGKFSLRICSCRLFILKLLVILIVIEARALAINSS